MTDSPIGTRRLTSTQWLICIIASIGFAFDIYELLMLPLIVRPALMELGGIAPGTPEFGTWVGRLFYFPAFAGGIFGLLGGYLTDFLGRRRVLTFSILLYAVSAFLAGFSTSLWMLLFFRCLVFVGVCVEFVAAVAWLAELFDEPKRREKVLGYTQAFSSIGGLMIAVANGLAVAYALKLPAVQMPGFLEGAFGQVKEPHAAWRYTLMSGLIPAIPLLVIRPFLPESPKWAQKKASGTLRRPSILELFNPRLRRTTIVTTIMFACSFGAAFGAIQHMPQMVPGLDDVKDEVKTRLASPEFGEQVTKIMASEETAKRIEQRLASEESQKAITDGLASPEFTAKLEGLDDTQKQAAINAERAKLTAAQRAKATGGERKRLEMQETRRIEQSNAANVTKVQEIGGLVGRIILAVLAVIIVSRRSLVRVFLIPGLIIMPLVFGYAAVDNLSLLYVGMFLAGLVTVGQFSFWGNYLPRVYPMHLRGTGESFAANIGGRLVGTCFAWVTSTLAVKDFMPGDSAPAKVAYTAAIIGVSVYVVNLILSFFLPEPGPEDMDEEAVPSKPTPQNVVAAAASEAEG